MTQSSSVILLLDLISSGTDMIAMRYQLTKETGCMHVVVVVYLCRNCVRSLTFRLWFYQVC